MTENLPERLPGPLKSEKPKGAALAFLSLPPVLSPEPSLTPTLSGGAACLLLFSQHHGPHCSLWNTDIARLDLRAGCCLGSHPPQLFPSGCLLATWGKAQWTRAGEKGRVCALPQREAPSAGGGGGSSHGAPGLGQQWPALDTCPGKATCGSSQPSHSDGLSPLGTV